MRNKFIRIMAGVLSAFMLLSQLTAVAEENTSENTSASAESAEQSKQTTPQIAEPKLTLSNELKATVINLGDFAAEKFGENFQKAGYPHCLWYERSVHQSLRKRRYILYYKHEQERRQA